VTKATGKLSAGLFALISGFLISLQSRINSELSIALESGIFAALISFGGGLCVISIITLGVSENRRKLQQACQNFLDRRIPFALAFAGCIGGFFVIVQSSIAGIVGISLFSIGVVSGTALSALFLDGLGLLGLQKRRINTRRVIGIVTAVAGLIVAGDFSNYSFNPVVFLAFLAGFGMGFQHAMNGKFGQILESGVVPTFFNFLTGVVFISIALLLLDSGSIPSVFPTNPVLYLGGLVGVIFIFIQVLVLPRLGALAMGLALLVGQLFGSLSLDLLVPIADRQVNASTIIGILLAIVGAGLVAKR